MHRARMSSHHEYKTRLGGHIHTRASVRLMHGMATYGMSCFGPCLYSFRPHQHHLVSVWRLRHLAFVAATTAKVPSSAVCLPNSFYRSGFLFVGVFPPCFGGNVQNSSICFRFALCLVVIPPIFHEPFLCSVYPRVFCSSGIVPFLGCPPLCIFCILVRYAFLL